MTRGAPVLAAVFTLAACADKPPPRAPTPEVVIPFTPSVAEDKDATAPMPEQKKRILMRAMCESGEIFAARSLYVDVRESAVHISSETGERVKGAERECTIDARIAGDTNNASNPFGLKKIYTSVFSVACADPRGREKPMDLESGEEILLLPGDNIVTTRSLENLTEQERHRLDQQLRCTVTLREPRN